MKEKKSIMEFNNGAILNRIDSELGKVLKNIADPNTDPVKPRKIKIELSVQANFERKDPSITVKVSSALQPTNPIKMNLFSVDVVDEATGEVKEALREASEAVPGQVDLSGNIAMPELYIPSNKAN